MMNPEEVLIYENHRANAFKNLASLFYLLQKDYIESNNVLTSLSTALQQVCPDAAGYSDKMTNLIREFTDQELAIEYTRLFIGPFKTLAPPYGSVYLENGVIMGDSTIDVLKLYNSTGLGIDENFKNLPDHIAAELEFMHYLVFNEIKHLENNDNFQVKKNMELQIHFCRNHLSRWVLQFGGKIIDGTGNPFYITLAECLMSFSNSFIPPGKVLTGLMNKWHDIP